MQLGSVGDVFLVLSAPLYRWRDRSAHREALQLYAAYGEGAVQLVRDKIAACTRYQDRKRLYRVHDEIARRLGDVV